MNADLNINITNFFPQARQVDSKVNFHGREKWVGCLLKIAKKSLLKNTAVDGVEVGVLTSFTR